MSTTGGPRLAGIGRTSDSNIILCADAHEAGSYPGEPTSNVVPNPNFVNGTTTTWTLDGTGASMAAIADDDNPVNSPYILKVVKGSSTTNVYTDLWNKTMQGGSYTFSCWVKGVGGMSFGKYDNNSGWGSGGELAVTLTGDWQLVTLYSSINGSDTTSSIKFFICYNLTGDYVYLAGPQAESKGYATPYVWGGYNGRPATTNLMVHGNVGATNAFKDSSPNKHTIATSGDTIHSNTQSKFPGGSIYFDGNGDYLTISEYLGGDWNFGSDEFSIDAWIYPTSFTDSSGNYGTIICSDDNSSSKAWNFRLNGDADKSLLFRYSTDGSNENDCKSGATGISLNNWYHVAVCMFKSRAGGTSYSNLEIFVDGVSKGFFNIAGNTLHSGTDGVKIGARGGPDLYFTGYMDEIRVTKGTALWRAAFNPPTRRNSNGPVVDLSGHDNAGNFATTDMTDVATFRDGQVIEPVASAVWDFDGTDDVIDLGNINYNGLPGLTVATWVYSSNFAANDSFMSSWGDNSNSNYAWLLFMSQWTSRKIDWLISSNGTSYNRCAGATALTDNLWYHVAATWTTSAMKLYLNGVEDGSQTSPSAIMNNDFNTFIGCDSDGSSEAKVRFFGGQMGNSAIWKTALTAAQVRQNFNAQRSRFGV